MATDKSSGPTPPDLATSKPYLPSLCLKSLLLVQLHLCYCHNSNAHCHKDAGQKKKYRFLKNNTVSTLVTRPIKNGDERDSLLRQARQWSLSQGKVLSGRMTACDPRGTCVQASAVGGMAHTVSPSIRWEPWHLLKWLLGIPSIGQHCCHQ